MPSSEVTCIVQQLRRGDLCSVEAWHLAALDVGAFLATAKPDDVAELMTGITALNIPRNAPRFICELRRLLVATLNGHFQSRELVRVPRGVWR